jgi:hypothetical protein
MRRVHCARREQDLRERRRCRRWPGASAVQVRSRAARHRRAVGVQRAFRRRRPAGLGRPALAVGPSGARAGTGAGATSRTDDAGPGARNAPRCARWRLAASQDLAWCATAAPAEGALRVDSTGRFGSARSLRAVRIAASGRCHDRSFPGEPLASPSPRLNRQRTADGQRFAGLRGRSRTGTAGGQVPGQGWAKPNRDAHGLDSSQAPSNPLLSGELDALGCQEPRSQGSVVSCVASAGCSALRLRAPAAASDWRTWLRVVRMSLCTQDLHRSRRVRGVDDDVSRPCWVPRGPQADSADALVVTRDALAMKKLRHHLCLRLVVRDRDRDLIGRRGRREQPGNDSPQRIHPAQFAWRATAVGESVHAERADSG